MYKYKLVSKTVNCVKQQITDLAVDSAEIEQQKQMMYS